MGPRGPPATSSCARSQPVWVRMGGWRHSPRTHVYTQPHRRQRPGGSAGEGRRHRALHRTRDTPCDEEDGFGHVPLGRVLLEVCRNVVASPHHSLSQRHRVQNFAPLLVLKHRAPWTCRSDSMYHTSKQSKKRDGRQELENLPGTKSACRRSLTSATLRN